MGAKWRTTVLFAASLAAFEFGAHVAVPGSALAAGPTSEAVTFTKDIAPIFQAKCESCHRPDSMAPMSLVTYENARPWARSIHADARALLRATRRPAKKTTRARAPSKRDGARLRLEDGLAKLRRRYESVNGIDFFSAAEGVAG